MPSIIFESFGEEESIELDLTKASEKEIKEAFIKSIKQTKKETKKNDQINYFFKLFFNSSLARINNYKHIKNKIGRKNQSSTNNFKQDLIMKKFLNFEEYNTILLAVNSSTDFIINGRSKKKEFYDTLFNKLFSIQEEDLLKKEEINYPITNS